MAGPALPVYEWEQGSLEMLERENEAMALNASLVLNRLSRKSLERRDWGTQGQLNFLIVSLKRVTLRSASSNEAVRKIGDL
jgi:hypothetical protein